LSVWRCHSCRILVDVSASSSLRCSACGGPLERGAAPATTVWDDDDPTERRPISYADDLARRARRSI
jgi:hypothetical protein